MPAEDPMRSFLLSPGELGAMLLLALVFALSVVVAVAQKRGEARARRMPAQVVPVK